MNTLSLLLCYCEEKAKLKKECAQRIQVHKDTERTLNPHESRSQVKINIRDDWQLYFEQKNELLSWTSEALLNDEKPVTEKWFRNLDAFNTSIACLFDDEMKMGFKKSQRRI